MSINDLMLQEPLALPSAGWAAGIPSNGLVALWNRALSKTELDLAFNALRGRFGI